MEVGPDLALFLRLGGVADGTDQGDEYAVDEFGLWWRCALRVYSGEGGWESAVPGWFQCKRAPYIAMMDSPWLIVHIRLL